METMQQYRQPVVTATGIFLGFMLNFVTAWLPTSFTLHKLRDTILAVGTMASIALLIVVLYRILRADYPEGSSDRFYKITLRLLIIGISIPFFSGVIIVLMKMATSIF
jgi:hypothetical protein